MDKFYPTEPLYSNNHKYQLPDNLNSVYSLLATGAVKPTISAWLFCQNSMQSFGNPVELKKKVLADPSESWFFFLHFLISEAKMNFPL